MDKPKSKGIMSDLNPNLASDLKQESVLDTTRVGAFGGSGKGVRL
tara:strand:- start:225 stop:359 length:135 start_codon:yes stop_codon:yes gene_type:complete